MGRVGLNRYPLKQAGQGGAKPDPYRPIAILTYIYVQLNYIPWDTLSIKRGNNLKVVIFGMLDLSLCLDPLLKSDFTDFYA